VPVEESVRDVALAGFGAGLELAEQYAGLLVGEGIEWGLLGPREADRIWERHLVNSLAIMEWVAPGSRVVDVGTGAGLPGIPLAIARGDCRVTLVEPMERRVAFLELCVDRLGLGDRVEVVRARAEECRGKWDVVTCRAVAPVGRLVEWTGHLVPPGQLLAIKGERAGAEVAAAEKQLARRGLKAEVVRGAVGGTAVGTVVRVRGR